MLIDWSHWKEVSETVKNWTQVAGVLGAVFLYYKWLFERRDRSTQVLFELEDRFAKEKEGCTLIEDEESYRRARPHLIRAVLPPDELEGHIVAGEAKDEKSILKPLDSLLRFYVLLLGICEAGQVSDSSLRACYRYWLAHLRLWRERQQQSGSDTDPNRARLAIETHLARISQHRPLETITDPDQRAEAEAVRSWFTQELLHAQLD